jgi:hypothetical protein
MVTTGDIAEGMTWNAAKEKMIMTTAPKDLLANLGTNGLPMWGEYQGLCIAPGSEFKSIGSVKLVRAVATASAVVRDPNFKLLQGWIADAVTTGYVPFLDNNMDAEGSFIFSKPDLPATLNFTDWYNTAVGDTLVDQLYMYEDSTGIRPTKLILAGKWSGSANPDSTFYPLSFVAGSNATAARDVTRNTKFYVIITKVNGDGYPDLPSAKKGEPMNITYRVVEWNQQTDGELMIDGSHHLIIDKRWSDVHVGPALGSYITLGFTTDYALSDFMMQPVVAAPATPIAPSNTSVSTARFKLELTTGQFKVTALEAYDPDATDLEQEFKVTCANKLTFTIKVTQDPTGPMDWGEGYPVTVE